MSSIPGINLCLGASYTISLEVEGRPRCALGVFAASNLGSINYFATSVSGEGEGNLLEVDVSGTTRLRKSELAFVCVIFLISASRIF